MSIDRSHCNSLHVEPRAVEIVITTTQIRVFDDETGNELKVGLEFRVWHLSNVCICPKKRVSLFFFFLRAKTCKHIRLYFVLIF